MLRALIKFHQAGNDCIIIKCEHILLLLFLLIKYPVVVHSEINVTNIAEQYHNSVIMLFSYNSQEPIGLGTACLIGSDGIVATNYHVILGADELRAKTTSGDVYFDIKILNYDQNKDLAILKITGYSANIFKLGDSSKANIGEHVVAIGSPQGFDNTYSLGIISQIRSFENGQKYIQTDAAVSPGNSGGPLLNKDSEVIGIITASVEDGQNLNFAVPSDALKDLLTQKTNEISIDEFYKLTTLEKTNLNLFEIRIGNKCGFMTAQGEIVIPAIFDWVSEFRDGLAAFQFYYVDSYGDISSSGYGFVNKKGEIVIEPQFKYPFLFSDGLGLYLTGQEGKWGFFDKSGDIVIDPVFDGAFHFKEGFAAVELEGEWGYIDKSGDFIIPPQFEKTWFFSEGLAPFSNGEKIGYIDTNGNIVIEPRFDYVESTMDYTVDYLYSFKEGLASIKYEGKCGYIDKRGTFQVTPQYQRCGAFSEGLASVEIDEKWGYVDRTGSILIKPQFDSANVFSEGLASVCIECSESWNNCKCGYINKSGVFVIDPTFVWAEDFKGGLALVAAPVDFGYKDSRGLTYINKNGEFIW